MNTGKKIISFSLYGSLLRYTVGAIRNSELVHSLFPGWICRFYVSRTVPEEILRDLRKNGAEIVREEGPDTFKATMWRFQAIEDPDVEYAIFRDCDSRLTKREAEAVADWLQSGLPFHIMRDYPWHTARMMAGMWGCRTAALRGIAFSHVDGYVSEYGVDQYFLGDVVYPKIRKRAKIHAAFWKYESCAEDFPSPRENGEFVGEYIDEQERFSPDARARIDQPVSLLCKLRNYTIFYAENSLIPEGVLHAAMKRMKSFCGGKPS